MCKVGRFCCLWTSVTLICKTYNFCGIWNLYIIHQISKAWCLGWGLDRLYNKKDVDFISFSSVDNVLATRDIFSVDGIVWGSWTRRQVKRRWDKHDLQPVTSFAKVYAVYKTVKSFLYAHSIGSLTNRFLWNWNWCSFIWNIRFWTEQSLKKKLLPYRY